MKHSIQHAALPKCVYSNVKRKRKVPPSHEAHRAALISVSSALSQTPVYTARPRIWG